MYLDAYIDYFQCKMPFNWKNIEDRFVMYRRKCTKIMTNLAIILVEGVRFILVARYI